jgi:hypothetical protein
MGQSADGFETVDPTHLTGDLYFVNRFTKWYWYLAGALCLLVPPAGAFLLTYFVASCVTTTPDAVDVYPED